MGAHQVISAADAQALRDELRQFRARTGLVTMDFVRATGISWAGIHYLATGKRALPKIETAKRLRGFMTDFLRSHPDAERERIGRVGNNHPDFATDSSRRCAAPASFIETQSARVVMAALERCATRRINGAIFGDPGVGKTAAMHQWSATTAHPHAIVFCRAYTSYGQLLRAIARALDIDGPATIGDLDETIHEELASRPRLVVIDEADMLGARTLDWLRTLWDGSAKQASFVLLAKPAFYQRLQVQHARSQQDLRQVWRRIQFRKFVPGISREETLEYLSKLNLAAAIDPAALDALHAAAAGSFGDLDMLIDLVRQLLEENPKLGGKVTAAVVRKAAEVRFGADIGRLA